MKTSHSRSLFLIFGVLLYVLMSGNTIAQKPASGGDRAFVRQAMSLRPELPPEAAPPAPKIELRPVRPGLFNFWRPVTEVASPSGDRAAGTTEGALYIRGAGGDRHRVIAEPEGDWRWDVEGALWSPDGKLIAARMISDRDVPRIPVVDWAGREEKVSMQPYTRIGGELPRHKIHIVEAATGDAVPVEHGEEFPYFHILDWSGDGRTLYFLRSDRLTKRLDLVAADARTGKTKEIFSERNEHGIMWWQMIHGYDERFGQSNLVRMLGDGRFIWTSEKSGFAHLYLHDKDGKPLRSLTEGKGKGFVDRLVEVDEKRGFAYVVMAGEDEQRPYDQTLYRVSLADGRMLKLSAGPTIGPVRFSRNMSRLWVGRTGLPDMLLVESMDHDGTDRKETWRADTSFLKEHGFAPEFVYSTAADGGTRLRSLILKPKDFDPAKKYPVVESIYGGPNSNITENVLQRPQTLEMQLIANRGFVVVLTDGRGTPGRGRDFRDAAAGRIGQIEIADRAAVLRQLGEKFKFMDLARVGVVGHSYGGYFAMRAMLLEPGLYKAGVLLAPYSDITEARVPIEIFMGCLPEDCPEAYAAARNMDLIDELTAPVLIIHGTADDDVPFGEAVKIVDALQKKRKEHELVVLNAVGHIVQREPLTFDLIGEFFEEHLFGSK